MKKKIETPADLQAILDNKPELANKPILVRFYNEDEGHTVSGKLIDAYGTMDGFVFNVEQPVYRKQIKIERTESETRVLEESSEGEWVVRSTSKYGGKPSILLVTAGIDDVWEPSSEEMDDVAQLFVTALDNSDANVNGAVVSVRNGITAEFL